MANLHNSDSFIKQRTEQDRATLITADNTQGVLNHKGPTHDIFATEQARLKSFSSWPPGLQQRFLDLLYKKF